MKKFIKWLNEEDTTDPYYAAPKNWVTLLSWIVMIGAIVGLFLAVLILPACCVYEPTYKVVEREGYFMIETRRYNISVERCRWKKRERAELMCSMLLRMEERRKR